MRDRGSYDTVKLLAINALMLVSTVFAVVGILDYRDKKALSSIPSDTGQGIKFIGSNSAMSESSPQPDEHVGYSWVSPVPTTDKIFPSLLNTSQVPQEVDVKIINNEKES